MGLLERTRRGPIVVGVVIALALALAVFALWWRVRHPEAGTTAARPVPGERAHVVVEVLNTTGAVGLARAATRLIRDAGLDVVYFGSDTGAVLDSTQVLVRRGSPDAAAEVARALGVGRVAVRPDTGRLVDVSVRIGRDFAARLARNP